LNTYPEISFVFVGSIFPKYNDFIKEKKRKFKKRFIVINPLSHTELFPIIKNSKFVVLPSLIENYSNSCIEAMALGKIVIATKNTSSEELINNGKNGFLIEINNSKEFLDKFSKIMKLKKTEIKKIEKNSQKEIERLSPDKTILSLEKFYNEIISQ
jgi:glycosyltransferase involved in cell wall biosynthesis